MNYKHLHYFGVVAKEGGIARANERLHVTPQTISGQLSMLGTALSVELFIKSERTIKITETARLVPNYVDEVKQVWRHEPEGCAQLFRLG